MNLVDSQTLIINKTKQNKTKKKVKTNTPLKEKKEKAAFAAIFTPSPEMST